MIYRLEIMKFTMEKMESTKSRKIPIISTPKYVYDEMFWNISIKAFIFLYRFLCMLVILNIHNLLLCLIT